MSKDVFDVERVVKLHHDKAYLEVGTDPDTATCVEIRTPDIDSRRYWGSVNLTLSKNQALQLADALRLVAEQLS